ACAHFLLHESIDGCQAGPRREGAQQDMVERWRHVGKPKDIEGGLALGHRAAAGRRPRGCRRWYDEDQIDSKHHSCDPPIKHDSFLYCKSNTLLYASPTWRAPPPQLTAGTRLATELFGRVPGFPRNRRGQVVDQEGADIVVGQCAEAGGNQGLAVRRQGDVEE